MKPITTKLHGMLDYSVGLLFIAMPWILKIEADGIAGIVFIAAGIAALVYSLFTKYELGLVKAIPLRIHLILDILSGIVLALSPWLFGFSDSIYLPHLILGFAEVAIALMTRAATDDNGGPHRI